MTYLSWRRNSIYFTLLLFLLALPDKNTAQNTRKTDSEVFFKYLRGDLKINPTDDYHVWILVPEFGCLPCIKKSLSAFSEILTNDNQRIYTVIYINPAFIDKSLERRVRCIHDTLKRMERLRLNIATFTIIKTKNEKIISLKPVNITDLDHVKDYF